MTVYRLRKSMNVPTAELILKIVRPLDFENSISLRGFIGRRFLENIFLHNHNGGSLIYSYPRVQYKIIDSKARIIGLAEGVEVIKNISYFEKIILGNEDVKVEGIDLSEAQCIFGISEDQQTYSFFTPWLALNEENHKKYLKIIGWQARKEFLANILIGNIISISKSLGYTVPEPIKVSLGKMKEIKTSLKGTPMLGFLGTFSVNFDIPDYWGIGKSVSRGFGTVKRIENAAGN